MKFMDKGGGGGTFCTQFSSPIPNSTNVYNLCSIGNDTVGVVTNPLQMFAHTREQDINHVLFVDAVFPRT